MSPASATSCCVALSNRSGPQFPHLTRKGDLDPDLRQPKALPWRTFPSPLCRPPPQVPSIQKRLVTASTPTSYKIQVFSSQETPVSTWVSAKSLSVVVLRLVWCRQRPLFCLLSHNVSRRNEGAPGIPDPLLRPTPTYPFPAPPSLRLGYVTLAGEFRALSRGLLTGKIGALITTRETAHRAFGAWWVPLPVHTEPRRGQPHLLPSLGAGAGSLCRVRWLWHPPVQPPGRSPAFYSHPPSVLTPGAASSPGDHGNEVEEASTGCKGPPAPRD